jgi:hypothetical protein
MKVKELIEKLEMFSGDLDIKICSFHRPDEELHHYNEYRNHTLNIVACHLDDLISIISTKEKDGSNEQIYLIDGGAFKNTSANTYISDYLSVLNAKCSKLNIHQTLINVSKTARHPDRKGKPAIDAITWHDFKADKEYISVHTTNGDKFFFNLVHNVRNGVGICDRAVFSSIEDLADFIRILELLQNEH